MVDQYTLHMSSNPNLDLGRPDFIIRILDSCQAFPFENAGRQTANADIISHLTPEILSSLSLRITNTEMHTI